MVSFGKICAAVRRMGEDVGQRWSPLQWDPEMQLGDGVGAKEGDESTHLGQSLLTPEAVRHEGEMQGGKN
jgi:hypothetical protein